MHSKQSLTFALCLWLTGCDDTTSTKPTSPAPAVDSKPTGGGGAVEAPKKLVLDATPPKLAPVDDATKAKAAGLVAQIDGMSFPREIRSDLANAQAFVYLAHTAEDPKVVAAALDAMDSVYTSQERPDERLVDADYHAVVAYRLASPDPAIATEAFEAARNSTDVVPPDPAVVSILVEIAQHHESLAGRELALDVLGELETPTAPVQVAFMHALDDVSPSFVALALDAMVLLAKGFADRPALVARLTTLLASPDAGVRGRAVEVLAATARDTADRQQLAALLVPLLDDPHPFPRGAAAYAMGSLRHAPAAPKLVEMLDDEELATIRVEGWANLDGSANPKRLSALAGDGVVGAALMALSLLSNMTDTKLEIVDVIGYEDGRGDYRAAVVRAKAWYAAHGEKLTRG